jgi:hypothetical protein
MRIVTTLPTLGHLYKAYDDGLLKVMMGLG